MISFAPHIDNSKLECVICSTGKVERTAFYLQSQGQPLFAWLHRGEQARSLKHGIILCAPIGYEQVHSHRSLRHLADALAQAGLSVLRFDYHGTGDSAGIDENAGRYAAWLANIGDAMTWMRQHLGCEQISLFGGSLGGIRGALLVAVDPRIKRAVLALAGASSAFGATSAPGYAVSDWATGMANTGFNGVGPVGIAADPNSIHDIYVMNYASGQLYKYNDAAGGVEGPAFRVSTGNFYGANNAAGIAFDKTGRLYVALQASSRVAEIGFCDHYE